MAFDVETEANSFSCAYGVSRDAVQRLLTRAIEDTEEEDIKAVEGVEIPHAYDLKGEMGRERFYQRHIRCAWAQTKNAAVKAIHERRRQQEEGK